MQQFNPDIKNHNAPAMREFVLTRKSGHSFRDLLLDLQLIKILAIDFEKIFAHFFSENTL